MATKVLICNECKKFHGEHVKKCGCGCQTLTETSPINREYIEWICTDPNTHQYGRQFGEDIFEFKEFNPFNMFPSKETEKDLLDENNWEQLIVDLTIINQERMRNHLAAYYNSIDEVKEEYGDSWKWIVAECYFEQETGLY